MLKLCEYWLPQQSSSILLYLQNPFPIYLHPLYCSLSYHPTNPLFVFSFYSQLCFKNNTYITFPSELYSALKLMWWYLLQAGDRVVALPEYRAWAELVAAPSRYVYKIPADLSFLDAAAMTMNYLVAYILLFELGGLTPGKSVLVHSAGGGVVSTHYNVSICQAGMYTGLHSIPSCGDLTDVRWLSSLYREFQKYFINFGGGFLIPKQKKKFTHTHTHHTHTHTNTNTNTKNTHTHTPHKHKHKKHTHHTHTNTNTRKSTKSNRNHSIKFARTHTRTRARAHTHRFAY